MRLLFSVFFVILVSNDAFVLQRCSRPSCIPLQMKRGDARGAALIVENASVYRGPSQILSNLNWRVEPNTKWAIVGANGCGKSTLLRSIIGDLNVDDGNIIISTKQQVGYLPQTAVAGSNQTIYEEAASAMKEIQEARQSLERAQEAVEHDASPSNLARLDTATQHYEAVGGYTQEQTVSSVLKGLGFQDMNQKCEDLSGGWQMRVALARLLLSQPTLLLLDEPSNHLDVNARKWLATYLKNYDKGAMVLVTHDTTLLEESVSHICEIAGGTLDIFKSCTFNEYLDEKQRRVNADIKEFEQNAKKAAKLQAFVDRFGATATKASAAQSRVKQLEKMKQQGLLEDPTTHVTTRFRPSLKLPDPPRAIGESLVSLKEASVGWTSEPLVSNIDFNVNQDMKIILRGPNGCGKSTILAALSGTLDLLQGTRTENSQLCLGVFTQDLAQELDANARAVDLVVEHCDGERQDAQSMLGRLGLSQEKALRLIQDLSGGEKARVALSILGVQENNLLLLDEPSNHLDVECMQALSQAVSEWEGSIVVVSHDEAFCKTIGFTHVGTVENGLFRLEERSLRASDWKQHDVNGDHVNGDDTSLSKQQTQADRKLQKQAYNAPKRIEKLESLMEELEVQAAEIDSEMIKHGSNVEKLLELTAQKQAIETKISDYMEEWEQLEELLLTVSSQ